MHMLTKCIKLLSEKQRDGQYHLVAIALDKSGKVLSTSFNSYRKTHPMQAKYANIAGQPEKHFLHAEIGALVKAKAQVYTLVVARIDKNGKVKNAKPCPICQLAIKAHGVNHVEYSI